MKANHLQFTARKAGYPTLSRKEQKRAVFQNLAISWGTEVGKN